MAPPIPASGAAATAGKLHASQRDASGATTQALIRGVIARSKLTQVIDLVKLLCPDSGHLGRFREWDRLYALPGMETARVPRSFIRLRSCLDADAPQLHRPTWAAHDLMYYGVLDRRAAPVEKRPLQVVPIGREGPTLLGTLGCKQLHEYVRKGARFRTRSGIIVELYLAIKLAVKGDPESARSASAAAKAAGTEPEEDLAIVEVFSMDRSVPSEELLSFMGYLESCGVMRSK